jgi:Glycosyl transferase family 4 group
VRGLGRDTAPGQPGFDALARGKPAREGHARQHPYLRKLEAATQHGQAAVRVMLALKAQGFEPDTILGMDSFAVTSLFFAKKVGA